MEGTGTAVGVSAPSQIVTEASTPADSRRGEERHLSYLDYLQLLASSLAICSSSCAKFARSAAEHVMRCRKLQFDDRLMGAWLHACGIKVYEVSTLLEGAHSCYA